MKRLVISARMTDRSVSSFKQYLKEISQIEIMTPKEEIECAIKSSQGDEDAIEELITRNLRFVISVAKQYATSQNPIEDLVNEGNLGLIIAAKKFNKDMGFRFISYAVWWIRKVILEHIGRNGRLIRLPANKLNSLSKLDKKMGELEQRYGREVDIQEIINSHIHELDLIKPIKKNGKTVYTKITDEYEYLDLLSTYTMDSLDRELFSDDSIGSSLYETLSDDTFTSGEANLIQENIKLKVSRAITKLKPRDQKIMIALYGLDGGIPRTLKDLGDEFGITREMVRQIKEKSLKKLSFSGLKECIG